MDRPYYPTKAAWAAAEATLFRSRADALPRAASADWRGVRRRMAAIDQLLAQARRYEAMASRYRQAGL